jgi:hypothetical protein
MAISEVRASGLEYLALATQLLHRVRLPDPGAGVWEAADLQWWWRTPWRSDAIDQLFWIDDEGPVASVVLTEWDRRPRHTSSFAFALRGLIAGQRRAS